MSLQKIQEDQRGLQMEIAELIKKRYSKSQVQSAISFQSAELALIALIDKQQNLGESVFNLSSLFLELKIENAYCFHFLRTVLNYSLHPCQEIESEIIRLKQGKSDFHRIGRLIVMREVLLGKLEKEEGVVEIIVDLRLVTQEVLKGILEWRKKLRAIGAGDQPLPYFYKGVNYPTKMLTDHSSILKVLNSKQPMFLPAPNPFLLTESSCTLDIPAPNKFINYYLEILAQQKAMELKMTLSPPLPRISHRQSSQQSIISSINKEKSEKQNTQRADKFDEQGPLGLGLSLQRAESISSKNKQSIKNLQRLIKVKEVDILRQLSRKKSLPISFEKSSRKQKEGSEPYMDKLRLLKAQVINNKGLADKNRKIQEMKKYQSQLRQTKPKIRLIAERQSDLQGKKQGIESLMEQTGLKRSRSTFYKQPEIEKQAIIASPTKNQMLSSVYSSASNRPNINFRKSQSKGKDKEQAKSRQQQLSSIKDSLANLNKKIKEQTIKNIYNSPLKSANITQRKPIQKQTSNFHQKQESKIVNDSSENDFRQKMKAKQNRINQLRLKLKQIKSSKMEPELEKPEAIVIVPQNSKQRQQLQLQNLKIKEQLKKQQLKFLSLKQKEYQLRQAQMKKNYKLEFQKMKEQLQIRNKQYQLKIIEQQKKNHQNEQKMLQIKKKSQMIALQLQEKEIREQVLSQLAEQQRKQGQKKKLLANEVTQQLKKQQERLKMQLQRKAIQAFEEEKIRLRQLYIDLQKKNAKLQEQNIMRKKQLQNLQLQKQTEIQSMNQLEKELQEKQKQIEFQRYIDNKKQKYIQSKPISEERQDIWQLKQKVKQEVMSQLLRQRQLQEQDEKIYERQRQVYIERMEEEVRKMMKIEQEQLKKIQQQYRIKNQKLSKQHEQNLMIDQMVKDKMNQQSNDLIKRLQHSQPFQVDRLVSQETGLENSPGFIRRQSSISQYELDRQESQFFVKQKQQALQEQSRAQQIEKKQPLTQQKKQTLVEDEIKDKVQPINQLQPPKIQEKKEIQPIQKQLYSVAGVKTLPSSLTSLTPQVQPQTITQEVKQSSAQIRQKYQTLIKLVTKPSKQVFMAFDQVQNYLNKFFSQLQPQVRQMLPYSRKQLESIFRQKKVDVFEGFSFGLYRPRQRKFSLLGNLDCIPAIAAKYGEIQVEQVYLFNKSSSYQKAYLTKQIKIFEKVGFIYQKKAHQEGSYTVKFIVKIPKDSSKEISLRDQLEIKLLLHFEDHNNSDIQVVRENSLYYILTQGLAETLTQSQKIRLAGRSDVQSKHLSKRLYDPLFSNNVVKTQIVSHKIVQMSINLPMKYIQTSQQPFYTLLVQQFMITTTGQRLYVAMFQQNNLAIVVHQVSSNDLPQDFTLETFIQSKFRKMEKISQMYLFLPVWQNSIKHYYKGSSPKTFSYVQKTTPSLVYGSIVKSKVHKGDFIFMEPPFAFLLFQISSAEVLKRILFGHIVKQEQIVKMKRVVA